MSIQDVGYIVDCRNGPSDYAYFWGPNGSGYTPDLAKAGVYTREEYDRRITSDSERAAHAFVTRDAAEAVAHRTVLFHDLPVKNEGTRRDDLKTEREAATLRAVFG